MHEGLISRIDSEMNELERLISKAEKELAPFKRKLELLSDCRRTLRGLSPTREEKRTETIAILPDEFPTGPLEI